VTARTVTGPSVPSTEEPNPSDPPKPEVRIIERAPSWLYVFVWLIGVLLASLTPLLLPYFHAVDQDRQLGAFGLLGHGELLLIALVLNITGISEVLLEIRNMSSKQAIAVTTAILGGLLAVIAEAFWYADLTADPLGGSKMAKAHVAVIVTHDSLGLFAASALSSAACVYFAATSR